MDDLSFRSTKSNSDPKITVFMHGLGSQAFHWSNDGKNNFAYEQESMPEQLRLYLGEENSEIIVVKVQYDFNGFVGGSYDKEDILDEIQ